MIRRVLIWFCLFITCCSLAAEIEAFRLQGSNVSGKASLQSSNPSSDPLLNSSNPRSLPDYILVLDTLLALYYPDLPDSDYLSIARQPTGYYVGVNRQADVYPRDFIPFWLEGDPGPRPLPYRKRGNEPLPHYGSETAGYWKAQEFDRHLYYGYPNFTKDVFTALEEKENRSSDQTRQLARAHAEHAMNLLNNQFGASDPAQRFKLDEDKFERLNPSQLNSYLIHLKKAVNLYGQLPDTTQTPVGDAGTKYGHTIMGGYLTLLQYSNPTDATAFLQAAWQESSRSAPSTAARTAYDEHLLFCSRLLLESCPINSILITEGDNDTYPLHYLQQVENYRPDILIINRHLLHLPRYVDLLRKGVQTGGILALSQSEATISSWKNERFIAGERAVLMRPEAVKEALAGLTDLPTDSERPIARMPFGAIQLTSVVDGPLFRPEASTLGLGNLVMLDLIATNYGQRPIAISVAINHAYFAYGNSWQQVGLVYNLGDEKPYYQVDINGTIAWSALLKPSQPIRYSGRQSQFYLKHLEKLVIATASYLDQLHEQGTAVNLIDNYLSHLNRKEIFNQHNSASLLKLMNRLGYDPVIIEAYVGMIREAMLAIPENKRGDYYQRRFDYLQHYMNTGEFE